MSRYTDYWAFQPLDHVEREIVRIRRILKSGRFASPDQQQQLGRSLAFLKTRAARLRQEQGES